MANDREGRGVGRKPGKSGAAKLSPEERALWEHTAQSIAPIKGKKGRVHAALEGAEEPPAPRRDPAPPASAKKPPLVEPPPRAAPPRATEPAKPPSPGPITLERRKARKLSSGRIDIEARIDLHGMRQAEAHTALRRFLRRAHADGKRWVLVITGKGAPQRTAHDERLAHEGEGRGILRRSVPLWLAEPELSAIIVGYTTASVRHGGEGALYIHLRKPLAAGGR